MLPTPLELRAHALEYRTAAERASKSDDKRLLAACALALAQIAEAIEGEGRIEAFLEAPKLKKLLASVDERVRKVIEQILTQQTQEKVTAEQVGAWRRRAEELRTAADNFTRPPAQNGLRRAAASYDRLADKAERSMDVRPAAASDETG